MIDVKTQINLSSGELVISKLTEAVMNYCVLGVILSSLVIPTFGSITYPQMALGGGYECVVIVTNQIDLPWEGAAQLQQGNRELWSGSFTVNSFAPTGPGEFSIKLASLGTKKFVLQGDSSLRNGYFQIIGDQGYSTENIVVSFFYNYREGDNLSDSTGTPPGVLDRKFSLPVETGININTGLAWAPRPDLNPESVLVRLLSSDGIEVARESVPFDGHLARFVNEILTVPTDFVGSVQLESERAFYLTGLRLESTPSGFQLTSTPPNGLSFGNGINLEVVKDVFWVRGSSLLTITGVVLNQGWSDAVWTEVIISAFDGENRFLGGDSISIRGINRSTGKASGTNCIPSGAKGYFDTVLQIDADIDHFEATAYGQIQETAEMSGQVSIVDYELKDDSGNAVIEGEIINDGSVPVRAVFMHIVLMDKMGRVIDIPFSQPEKTDLEPQEKTTFTVRSFHNYSSTQELVFRPTWSDVIAATEVGPKPMIILSDD